MTRNLKALGLALVAVFAMSAIAASAAQAATTDFNAPEAVEVDAIADSAAQEFLLPTVLPKNPLTCTEVSGNAPFSGQTGELNGESIAYNTCHVVIAGITLPVTVDMNGCHFLFTGGTYDSGPPELGTGSVHIQECGATKSITITVFASKTKHAENIPQCTYHIKEQTISGLVYHNATTETKMAVTVEAPGVTVKTLVTNNGATGCKVEEETNATYTGSFWAKGTNAAEEYVDTTITGTP